MRVRPLIVLWSLCFLATAVAAQVRPTTPLPADPLELATGPAKLITTADERTSVLNLLERIRQNNVLHTPGSAPYRIKATFDSSGNTAYTGPGEFEEIWLNGQRWRWTAKLGGYFQTRIFFRGGAYDQKSPGAMPLRLQMMRNAIVWPAAAMRPGATIRATAAKWKGADVLCALMSRMPPEALAQHRGRAWQETEYCIDPKSGLLLTYSDAPGIYTVYDYGDALHFDGRTFARQITVVESGNTVLTVNLDTLEAAGAVDPKLFVPTPDMLSQGPGAIMSAALRWPQFAPVPAGYDGTVEPVIVHAIIGPDGKVEDAEALPTSDAVLSRAALDLVRNSTYSAPQRRPWPQQREAYINVQFVAKR